MSDLTEHYEYYKKAWERALAEQTKHCEERGFDKAVKALCTLEADGLHEMYAVGFAEWLEKKKQEILT